MNVRSSADQPSAAVWTDYPTQAGGFFRWAQIEGTRAYNPSGISPSGWNTNNLQQGIYTNTAWSSLLSFESCPPGYRRPIEGDIINRNHTSIDIAASETQQSLFVNAMTGGNNTPTNNTSNVTTGFYADGFFDRRPIGTEAASSGSTANTAVSTGNSAVAFKGILLYNPDSQASLFFPFTGHRWNGNGRLESTGTSTNFWTSGTYGYYPGSIIDYSWLYTLSSSGLTQRSIAARGFGFPIRCVVDSPIPPGMGGGGTPPTSGSIAPENILAVNNLGQLNLDGQKYVGKPGTGITSNYIVYFKWGSLVAISSDITCAWYPAGLNYQLPDIPKNTWTGVHFLATGPMPAEPDPVTGLGDPCMVATKNGGEVGNWRMPTGNPYEKFTDGGQISNYTVDGVNYGNGRLSTYDNQFYPYAGMINSYTNKDNDVSVYSEYTYLTSSQYATGNHIYKLFVSSNPPVTQNGERNDAFPIRCLPK